MSVIGLLSSALSLASKLWSWFVTRSEQKAGADAQSARDSSASLKAEREIAQAESDAPKSADDVDERLEDHSL